MAFNQKLRFSWGHIIAFVAMIVISYLSFMGITYYTDGNFLVAGLGVIVVNLVLVLFFIVPQILKGVDRKFSKRIVYERLLFFAAPVAFVVAMFAYSHFWVVFEKRGQLENVFSSAMSSSRGVFNSYDVYADGRIKNYEESLNKTRNISSVRKNNAVEALKLQIFDENYNTLKKSANDWLDNASGATVWNVFMIGNRKTIEKAMDEWNSSLNKFSSKIMTDEPAGTEPFSLSHPSIVAAKSDLAKVKACYTQTDAPTFGSVLLGLFLYLMMLVPYVIQSRNTKSIYRLVGLEPSYMESKVNLNRAAGDGKVNGPSSDRSFEI